MDSTLLVFVRFDTNDVIHRRRWSDVPRENDVLWLGGVMYRVRTRDDIWTAPDGDTLTGVALRAVNDMRALSGDLPALTEDEIDVLRPGSIGADPERLVIVWLESIS